MKTSITMFIYYLLVISLSAQPRISDSWVPEPGDSWTAALTIETPSPGEGGENVTWDYSDLNVNGYQYVIDFEWLDPATTPYVDSFPDATVCSVLGAGGFNNYGYYQKSEGSFSYLGTGGDFVIDLFTDPQEFNYINMDYGETRIDTYELVRYTNYSSPSMPIGTTSNTYDGYGKLVLPQFTIDDVVRIYQVDVEVDSTGDASIAANVRIDSLITYAWVAEGSVFPVVQWQRSSGLSRTYIFGEITLEEADEAEEVFTINPFYDNTSDVRELANLKDINVYPNASSEFILVSIDANEQNKYEIFSLQGKLVKQGRLSGLETKIDIAEIQNGYYLLTIPGYRPKKILKVE